MISLGIWFLWRDQAKRVQALSSIIEFDKKKISELESEVEAHLVCINTCLENLSMGIASGSDTTLSLYSRDVHNLLMQGVRVPSPYWNLIQGMKHDLSEFQRIHTSEYFDGVESPSTPAKLREYVNQLESARRSSNEEISRLRARIRVLSRVELPKGEKDHA